MGSLWSGRPEIRRGDLHAQQAQAAAPTATSPTSATSAVSVGARRGHLQVLVEAAMQAAQASMRLGSCIKKQLFVDTSK